MPYFNTVHVNQPLTNVSVRYTWSEGIADQVFPEVQVAKESDVFFIYDREHLRLDETLRANKAPANEVGYDYSTATYTLEEHSLKGLVTDRDRTNADAPLSLDVDMTEHLTQKLMIRRENDVAAVAFTTATWANSITIGSGTRWDTSVSNPIGDVATATSLILRTGMVRPNKGVLGRAAFRELKTNSVTTARILYSQRGVVTEEILAGLFDLDKILVGNAAFVSSVEGAAETTASFWGPGMLVYYTPAGPSLRTASAGYTFTVGGRFRTKKWREEERAGDYIEVSTMFLARAVATSAGIFLAAVSPA